MTLDAIISPAAAAPSGASDGSATLGFVLIAAIFAAYMFPTIVAVGRRHNNALAISMLNIFLGWSVLGWIAALIWSCTSNRAMVRA